jgi:hypothetical protein
MHATALLLRAWHFWHASLETKESSFDGGVPHLTISIARAIEFVRDFRIHNLYVNHRIPNFENQLKLAFSWLGSSSSAERIAGPCSCVSVLLPGTSAGTLREQGRRSDPSGGTSLLAAGMFSQPW